MALFTNTATATATPLTLNSDLFSNVEVGYAYSLTRENRFGYRSVSVGTEDKKQAKAMKSFNVDGRHLNWRKSEEGVAMIELRTEKNLDLPTNSITYNGDPIDPSLIGNGSKANVTVGHRKNSQDPTKETIYIKAIDVIELVVFTPNTSVDF